MGPIQELRSLDMMLAALPGAIERGDQEQTREVTREMQTIAERNIQALRDEIVALGPYAFRELSVRDRSHGVRARLAAALRRGCADRHRADRRCRPT